MIRIKKETTNQILSFTNSLLEKYPVRTPGATGSIAAAGELSESMEGFCNTFAKETFVMYPGALFNTGRILGATYALSLIFFSLGGVFDYIAFGLCILVLGLYCNTLFFLRQYL